MKDKIVKKFHDKKIAINVETQEEYDNLMEYLEDLEFEWLDGQYPTDINVFSYYGEKTCIDIETSSMRFDQKSEYQCDGFEIIPYQDFMNEVKLLNE